MEGVKIKLVGLLVKRHKEGQTLNVVPVIMAEQDVGANRPAAEFLGQRLTQHAQARAAINDQQASAVGAEFKTRQCFRRSEGSPVVAWAWSRGLPRT